MNDRRFAVDRETLARECAVDFFKSSGPGGQHKNKRETGVRLFHPPSGLTVTAVERRSQKQNLDMAYARLARRLTELNRVPKKRKATRPSSSSVRRRLEAKSRRSRRKEERSRPGEDE